MRKNSLDQRKELAPPHGLSQNMQKQETMAAVSCKACDDSSLCDINSSLLLEIQALFGATRTRSGREKQRKIPKLANRKVASEESTRKWEKFLKPGTPSPKASRRATRASCIAAPRSRIVETHGDAEPSNMILASPTELAKRRILTQPAPEALYTVETNCFQLSKFSAPNAPSTPVSRMSWIEEAATDSDGASLLEALPLDLLVRIVCSLHHDELKPMFHVSMRLRTAVLIARQCHFDFTTPDRERQGKLGLLTPRPEDRWPFSSGAAIHALIRPPTPKAPRHLPNNGPSRIFISEMRQIAATLFQEPTPHRSQAKTRRSQRSICRGTASHRVLFYEDELCQAVAHNTIRFN